MLVVRFKQPFDWSFQLDDSKSLHQYTSEILAQSSRCLFRTWWQVSMFDMVNGQMCNQESYLSSFTPWFFWLDALVWLPCLWSRSFMPTVTQQWRLAKCILHWITSSVEFQTLALSLTCSWQNHVGSHYDDRYIFKTCYALILLSLHCVLRIAFSSRESMKPFLSYPEQLAWILQQPYIQ